MPSNVQVINLNDVASYITLPSSPSISVSEQNQQPSTSSPIVSSPFLFTGISFDFIHCTSTK